MEKSKHTHTHTYIYIYMGITAHKCVEKMIKLKTRTQNYPMGLESINSSFALFLQWEEVPFELEPIANLTLHIAFTRGRCAI